MARWPPRPPTRAGAAFDARAVRRRRRRSSSARTARCPAPAARRWRARARRAGGGVRYTGVGNIAGRAGRRRAEPRPGQPERHRRPADPEGAVVRLRVAAARAAGDALGRHQQPLAAGRPIRACCSGIRRSSPACCGAISAAAATTRPSWSCGAACMASASAWPRPLQPNCGTADRARLEAQVAALPAELAETNRGVARALRRARRQRRTGCARPPS